MRQEIMVDSNLQPIGFFTKGMNRNFSWLFCTVLLQMSLNPSRKRP